ncbi:MAG: hypothetical protein V1867_08165 [Candidatus Falkowbacteria bacterium]
MKKNAKYSLRRGTSNENDWVIIDQQGKTVLELSRYDMWEIEEKFNKIREESRRTQSFAGMPGTRA